ncbi:MAG: hypothetical protein PF961_13105 [Planctomycetota bacterium]|jgi:hypothetical protein|nr:hypothetical protein [Planctomycetota bacterium]
MTRQPFTRITTILNQAQSFIGSDSSVTLRRHFRQRLLPAAFIGAI